MKKKVLVVPCGTEIGLEIAEALKGHKDYDIYGANSIEDYSRHVYKNVINGMPFVTENGFVEFIQNVIKKYEIDFIIPSHDDATVFLKENESTLGCAVICADIATTQIARSKKSTYDTLKNIIRTPNLYQKENIKYPAFVKPDIGQGSKGAYKINTIHDLHLIKNSDVICEYLPGEEFTVDCLSDKNGKLIQCSPRIRTRIRNGIAIGTKLVTDKEKEFFSFARKISQHLNLKGAWFFQVKRDAKGVLCLLEIAVRISGSMALSRVKGINFVELSLLIHQGYDICVIKQDFNIEMDRALDRRFVTDIHYNNIYIDFDDCIAFDDGKLNLDAIQLIVKAHNQGKKVFLISRHKGDLKNYLERLRIEKLFDKIIHIQDETPKSHFIKERDAIFIDDAFSERLDVSENCKIPVFSIDSISALLG